MFEVEVNGRRFTVRVAEQGGSEQNGTAERRPTRGTRRASARLAAPADGVVSALQGTVAAVRAEPGQAVEAAQVLFIIEAMKMENEVAAPHAGTLAEIRVQPGQVVEAGTLLATYQSS